MWDIINQNKKKTKIIRWFMIIGFTMFSVIDLLFVLEYIVYTYFAYKSPNPLELFFSYLAGVVISLLVYKCIIYKFTNNNYKGFIDINSLIAKKNDEANVLKDIVSEMKIASGLKKEPKIFILDISHAKILYSFGTNENNAGIVISKWFLENLTRDELQGAIAHEIAHIVNGDIYYISETLALTPYYNFISSKISIVVVVVICLLIGLGKNEMLAAFEGAILLYVILFLMLTILVCGLNIFFANVFHFLISVKKEYMADAYACIYTRYPKGLAGVFEKISIDYNCNKAASPNISRDIAVEDMAISGVSSTPLVKTSNIVSLYFDNNSFHPPITERIKILYSMTSADLNEYERSYEIITRKKNLISQSDLKNSQRIEIRKSEQSEEQDVTIRAIAAACALDTIVFDEKLLKENKQVLQENIQKRRKINNAIRDVKGYKIINCDCETILKIPPEFQGQKVICPHCSKEYDLN